MDLARIRKLVIIAMFSDDTLTQKLVVKGGNALEIVHGIISRGSIDVDLERRERRAFDPDVSRHALVDGRGGRMLAPLGRIVRVERCLLRGRYGDDEGEGCERDHGAPVRRAADSGQGTAAVKMYAGRYPNMARNEAGRQGVARYRQVGRGG